MEKFYPLFAVILLGACATAPAPTATHPPHVPKITNQPVWIIAHRGGGLAPENTLAAFQNALALGVDVLEMDTHLSKDGVVVVIHDAAVDRTTDGSGPVAEKTEAELQALNAAAKFGGGTMERQPVPTFAQALDLIKDLRVSVEVEIKVPPNGRYAGIEAKVLREIGARGLIDRVRVSSFDFDVLRDLKKFNPRIKTVALMGFDFFRRVPLEHPAQVIEAALAVQAEVIAVHKDLLTPAMVNEARQRGLKVEVWTVDGESEMQKFIQMGVDGIITNRPDRAKQVVGK